MSKLIFLSITTEVMFMLCLCLFSCAKKMSEESLTLKYCPLPLPLPQNPGKLPPNRDFYTYISTFRNIF